MVIAAHTLTPLTYVLIEPYGDQDSGRALVITVDLPKSLITFRKNHIDTLSHLPSRIEQQVIPETPAPLLNEPAARPTPTRLCPLDIDRRHLLKTGATDCCIAPCPKNKVGSNSPDISQVFRVRSCAHTTKICLLAPRKAQQTMVCTKVHSRVHAGTRR